MDARGRAIEARGTDARLDVREVARVRARFDRSDALHPVGDEAMRVAANRDVERVGGQLVEEAEELFLRIARAGVVGVRGALAATADVGDERDELGPTRAKLCGLAARYSLGLHCLETVGRVSGFDASEISVETLSAALAWTPYLIEHERIAMGVVGCDPLVGQAERVLRWLERTGLNEFSLRDCFTAVRGQAVRQTHDLGEPVRLLVDLGYIRPLPTPDRAGKAGQPPSPRYGVNPLWQRGGAM